MIRVIHSNVNQCWFGMWNDQVLRLFNSKGEAEAWRDNIIRRESGRRWAQSWESIGGE